VIHPEPKLNSRYKSEASCYGDVPEGDGVDSGCNFISALSC
jgi:hypothetical protein